MADAGTLIEKHREKGVFVDTNLLVLLLVGSVNIRRIPHFKRTQNFTIEDFYVLRNLVKWFGAPLVSTPHVLSQVSDLTDLKGLDLIAIREEFRSTVERIEERYDSAKRLINHRMFNRFGLGDASIAAVCERKIVVLTADVQLQVALEQSGLDAINFNHIRQMNWK